jgi:hypothetical protein
MSLGPCADIPTVDGPTIVAPISAVVLLAHVGERGYEWEVMVQGHKWPVSRCVAEDIGEMLMDNSSRYAVLTPEKRRFKV